MFVLRAKVMGSRLFAPFLASINQRQLFSTSVSEEINTLFKTPLHDFHMEHGGKMVPFAGWSMPFTYEELSVFQSVHHTRKSLSMFDVSHMLQLEVSGNDAEGYLESVLVSDLKNLKEGKGTLSLLTNDHGGIVDDCIVTCTSSKSFYVVANAACADKDKAHLQKKLDHYKGGSADVLISVLADKALIALQGPMLSSLMKDGIKGDLSKLYFMDSAVMGVYGIEGRVSRCGYTGEDGVEISVPSSQVVELCHKILKNSEVKLAGLGSRDILRTEAGLCLYGNDISEETTPVEAGLAWCIGKRRRKEGGFSGSQVILGQLINHVTMKRVGLISKGPLLRQHCSIVDDSGCTIGHITSGCPSPTLGCNVAMGYLPAEHSVIGNKVNVVVRNKAISAIVSKMPFVPCSYYRKRL